MWLRLWRLLGFGLGVWVIEDRGAARQGFIYEVGGAMKHDPLFTRGNVTEKIWSTSLSKAIALALPYRSGSFLMMHLKF